jgi:AAA family ATP:ADP antiporter
VVLSIFVPIYTVVSGWFGQRTLITGTLLFFALNVLGFWYLFTYHPAPLLSAAFYIWVNCFGIIAPVQVWIFANSIFDTRQAKRLFGVIAGGASLGAILGGLLATTLVRPIGGPVNLLLVLAGLIGSAAVIVNLTRLVIPPRGPARQHGTPTVPLGATLGTIARTHYLALIAASVFLVAIVTQWSQFQFSLVAQARHGQDAAQLTRFFGQFNLYLGIVTLGIQLLLTGPMLRQFGVGLTIMLLPVSMAIGSTLILAAPVFWSVVLTNSFDQGLRFSIDKATYELLYLPMSPTIKSQVKVTIDTIINRCADAVGGILLGLATREGFNLFFIHLPGAGLEVRGIAAINLVFIGAWIAVATALRRGYVDVIRESIHQHRLDAERASGAVFDRSATELLASRLRQGTAEEVLYALELFESQHARVTHPAVRSLLGHEAPAVRRRALAILHAAGDSAVIPQVEALLSDPDLEVRTEALLFLTHHSQVDPLARIQELGDFADFSIRGGVIAFLARSGRWQNLDAVRVMLGTMVSETGESGKRSRLEAARLLASLPDQFADELQQLLEDDDVDVVREALRSAGRLKKRAFVRIVLKHLANPGLVAEATEALGRFGDPIVGTVRDMLFDPDVPLEIRREIPSVFVQIATPSAERALMESLLEGDTTLRFRVIASLNKLRQLNPDIQMDTQIVEIALAAEIMGHYRSYQILGTLGDSLAGSDPVVVGLKQSMEQEVERIFRLMGLLFPTYDLHSAYFGLRSGNAAVRANALEFLDNILQPQLRSLVVPLLDSYVSVTERVRQANRLLGTAMESREQAVEVLAASDDSWMRSCAAYAIGALKLVSLAPELEKWINDPDPLLRETARAAKKRLETPEPADTPTEIAPPEDAYQQHGAMGVG